MSNLTKFDPHRTRIDDVVDRLAEISLLEMRWQLSAEQHDEKSALLKELHQLNMILSGQPARTYVRNLWQMPVGQLVMFLGCLSLVITLCGGIMLVVLALLHDMLTAGLAPSIYN